MQNNTNTFCRREKREGGGGINELTNWRIGELIQIQFDAEKREKEGRNI